MNNRPDAICLIGHPGVGKSSFAGHFPNALSWPTAGEDRTSQLKKTRVVPQSLKSLPTAETWQDVHEGLTALREGEHDYKTLIIDSMTGFERLCHEEVCRRDYNNDWSRKQWLNYSQGPKTAVADWRIFLSELDHLRNERKMMIVMVGHVEVKNIKNPGAPDYDKFVPDVDKATWAMTHRWADMVLFYTFELAFSDDAAEKSKAKGGQTRIIYTQNDAAFEAKNCHNLPPEILAGNSAAEAYQNFKQAIIDGRKAVRQ